MSSARPLLPLLVALGLLLPGCDRSTPEPAPPTRANPTVNVVVFMIDTLRADRVGAYGYDKPTSPTLDLIAREGVVFENAQTAATWTCPSIPSLMTSTFLCEHGITSELKQLSPKIRTLAERFQEVGYHTMSMYINTFAGPTTGMTRGFDQALENPTGFHAIDGSVVSRWAADRPDKPFFLYVHNIEPHNPFQAPDELIRLFGDVNDVAKARQRLGMLISNYRPRLRPDWKANHGLLRPLGSTDQETQLNQIVRALDAMLPAHQVMYDAVVRHADIRLASVIEALKAAGTWDNTLLIVLSDHGEEMSERGDYLHSQSVYGELTNVPLIVRFPDKAHAGTRVREVVSTVDVLPTIFDYLGREDLNAGARGRSLMPLVRGEPTPIDAAPFLVTTVRVNEKKWRSGWAVRGNVNVVAMTRDGKWKGIWNVENSTFELYNLEADPGERYNQCQQHSELADSMVTYLKAWYAQCTAGASTAGVASLSDEALKGLEALGYVGGDEDVVDLEGDDTLAAPQLNFATEPCPVEE